LQILDAPELRSRSWETSEASICRKVADEITRQDVSDLINKKLSSVSAKGRITSRGTHAEHLGPVARDVEPRRRRGNPCGESSQPCWPIHEREEGTKSESHELDPLTREEVQILLESAERYGYVTYAVILAAVRTGLRMGELFGLQW